MARRECEICGDRVAPFRIATSHRLVKDIENKSQVFTDGLRSKMCEVCAHAAVVDHDLTAMYEFLQLKENMFNAMDTFIREGTPSELIALLTQHRYIMSDEMDMLFAKLQVDHDELYDNKEYDKAEERQDEFDDALMCMFVKLRRRFVDYDLDVEKYYDEYINEIAPFILAKRYGIEAEIASKISRGKPMPWAVLARPTGMNPSKVKEYFEKNRLDKDNMDAIQLTFYAYKAKEKKDARKMLWYQPSIGNKFMMTTGEFHDRIENLVNELKEKR